MADGLAVVHQLAALALDAPELELEEKEAKALAAAIAGVSEQYGTMAINPRTVALGGLIFVVLKIYGPRAVAIRARAASGKAKGGQGEPQRPSAPPTSGGPLARPQGPAEAAGWSAWAGGDGQGGGSLQ